jgi:hypothetical protein
MGLAVADAMPSRRFLCDEMLARLGRYLRAAGYDTGIAEPGTADAVLLSIARLEGRTLLTRDRELRRRRGADGIAFVVPPGDLEVMARALTAHLAVDWLFAPFSRCLVDNTPLRAAAGVERALAPASASFGAGRLFACPDCGRVYWPGSHHRRMHARLSAWRAAADGALESV